MKKHMLGAVINRSQIDQFAEVMTVEKFGLIHAPVALALTYAEVEAIVDKLADDAAVCDPGDPLAGVLAAAHAALVEIEKETNA